MNEKKKPGARESSAYWAPAVISLLSNVSFPGPVFLYIIKKVYLKYIWKEEKNLPEIETLSWIIIIGEGIFFVDDERRGRMKDEIEGWKSHKILNPGSWNMG